MESKGDELKCTLFILFPPLLVLFSDQQPRAEHLIALQIYACYIILNAPIGATAL